MDRGTVRDKWSQDCHPLSAKQIIIQKWADGIYRMECTNSSSFAQTRISRVTEERNKDG